MERYIAQRADQALEAMCGRESLTKRLQNAKMYFLSVSNDHFLGTAPEDVRESITVFLKSKTGRGSKRSSALVKSAICSSLLEFGRQDALLSLSLKQQRDIRAKRPKAQVVESTSPKSF
jgi:hypothetical protein